MLISVVMPVYNHAPYLAAAIDSVLAQTHQDWELLAVDDGSTDASGRILDDYTARDRRVRVFHQANAGPGAARNRALAEARGDYVAYLDSDDVWFADTLSNYAAFFAAHPQAGFVYGYRHRLNADGSTTESTGDHQDGPTGAIDVFRGIFLNSLCICHRKDLADRAGGFDERLRTAQDYDLWLRMTRHTPLFPLGKATGLRRRHDTNISRESGRTRLMHAFVLERFLDDFGGRQIIPPAVVARRMARLYRSAAHQYLRGRHMAQAARCAKRSLGYRLNFGAVGLLALAILLRFRNIDDPQPLSPLRMSPVFGRPIHDRFSVILPRIREGSVLDVGCVDARCTRATSEERIEHKPDSLFRRICEANPAALGVDIDPAGVQVLQSMGYNAVCADAETMDLGRTFDTIVAGEVVEHPENPGLFLRNLRRHLAANGRLFISTPNPFYADQSWKIWRYGRPAVHEDHLGWQDPITLAALLRHTGFEPLEGWWVQPECKLLRTWKRLFRRHFSHTFMILARPGRFDRASLADAGSPGGKEAR